MFKCKIKIPQEIEEVFDSIFIEMFGGFEENFEEDNKIYVLYFEEPKFIEELKSFEIYFLDIKIEFIGDEWKEKWKKYVKPVEYKNFFIHPSFIEDKKDKINIIIEPSFAFGTGEHETTRICIETIIDLFEEKKDNDKIKFLDVGTGSGILSIIAHKLGVRDIISFDIDPLAVKKAKEHFEINNIEVNSKNGIKLFTGGIEGLKDDIKFDFIVANIISSVLKQITPKLKLHLKENSLVLFSGILKSEIEDFIRFLENEGFSIERIIEKEKWAGVIGCLS